MPSYRSGFRNYFFNQYDDTKGIKKYNKEYADYKRFHFFDKKIYIV